jgi:hypothetical protein
VSWKATAHVLNLAETTERDALSPTHLLVLFALAGRHSPDYGCAWGQLERVARDSHLGQTALTDALNYLEEKRYITVWVGDLPRVKNASQDGRRRRGLLYCFRGLDAEDGPNMEGVEPRKRLGGRPKSVSPNETDSAPDQFRLAEKSVPAGGEIGFAEGGDQFRRKANSVPAGGPLKRIEPAGEPDVKPAREPAGSRTRVHAREKSPENPPEPLVDETRAVEVWAEALRHLQGSVPEHQYATYLAATSARGFDAAGALVVEAANPFHLAYLSDRLGTVIHKAAAAVLGEDVVDVRWLEPPAIAPPDRPKIPRVEVAA